MTIFDFQEEIVFWDNFSRICAEKETNPSAVCIAAGLQKNRPYNWKSGTLPKQEELISLARVLDVTVADFFSEGPVKEFENGTPLNSYEFALLEIFDELDTLDQADVMIYARNLRDRRIREEQQRTGRA